MQAEQQQQLSPVQAIIAQLMSGEGHLSYSSISAFAETPETFIEYKTGQKEETESMIFGSMLHCLVLEPEDFENRYHVLDDRDICVQIGGAKPRATKAYKEWKEAAMQEAAGKILVETDDYLTAKRMARKVRSNRASAKILGLCGNRETGIEWEYKNFKFKGYIDGYGSQHMFDLKMMPDADPKRVHREIIDRGLHIQAAMYEYGLNETEFKAGLPTTFRDYHIVAIDKKCRISVHKLHKNLIEYGMVEYNRILDLFNHCIIDEAWDQSFDFFAERTDGIYICEKPKWLY